MLTGDRPDTATNVAVAVRLISTEMRVIKLLDASILTSKEYAANVLRRELETIQEKKSLQTISTSPKGFVTNSIRRISNQFLRREGDDAWIDTTSPQRQKIALVVNDAVVEAVKQFGLEYDFMRLCINADSVLCARVSPKQKEFLVDMVRTQFPNKVTMAVGDGANDVPMIQRAHIGIGIAGEEGAQAADSSDYSIPQFRFLQKLVLVYGRWMHRRISVLTFYIFYKNVLLVLPQFIFGIYCLFSGQSTYFDPLLQIFNVAFTSLPILFFSVMDQDVSASIILRFPRLYDDGPRHAFLNEGIFFSWILEAVVSSVLVTLVPSKLMFLVPWSSTGKDTDLWSMGLAQFYTVVLLANARLFVEVSSHHLQVFSLALVSILGWWAITFFFQSTLSISREFYGIFHVGVLTQLGLCSLFCTVVSLLLVAVPKVYAMLFHPKPRTICREIDYLDGERPHQATGKVGVKQSDTPLRTPSSAKRTK
ncbi:hypothetical protein PINS_up020842 [Pythium insidiosum]|nr:hypothetical protein PINS_up003909 [Pythium insidiosum]GLE09239.1 hypothetical protein PINS_up020842 [Pythium insidiosum]